MFNKMADWEDYVIFKLNKMFRVKDMTLGARIRSLREERQLTQIALAKELGITCQALSQYELNKRMPDVGMIIQLSDYFNVTTDFLLRGIVYKDSDRFREENPGYGPPSIQRQIQVADLSEEAVEMIEDYIGYIRQKYKGIK